MAGKKKYKIENIIEAIEKGHTPKGAAEILGCHPDTVRNYAEINDEVRRALVSERKDLIDIAKGGLRKHLMRGEAWAIAFTLKTLGKDEGFTERQEITGKDGSDVTIKVVYDDK